MGGCRKASWTGFLGGVCCLHSLGVQDSHSSRKASNTVFQAGVWERGGTAGVPDLFTCAPMLLAALAPC